MSIVNILLLEDYIWKQKAVRLVWFSGFYLSVVGAAGVLYLVLASPILGIHNLKDIFMNTERNIIREKIV